MKPSEAGEFKFLAGGGEMGGRIRDFDWEHSALGPIEQWPAALLSTLSICLSARFPMAIYWGNEGVLLYNDAWRPILGDKHPWALGRAAREVWPEIWEAINPLFESVRATGQATWRGDELLPMQRFGYTEECFFDYSFNPITGKSGEVEGILNVVQETTSRVLSERRTRLLQELASCSGAAKSEQRAGELAIAAMAKGTEDIPFALLYVNGPEGSGMRLAGATGLTPGNLARLTGAEGEWPFEEARRTGKPVVVEDLGARFGTVHAGRWPEPVKQAVLLPVAASGQDAVAAMLVMGVSPRRKLDEDYRRFFELAASHVASMLASATAYEEERKRAEALAELDRAKTSFFGNVSHELRTPLTLILGPLEDELRESAAPKERLELAHRNSLRLLKLVNTLLDFSRIEAGRVEASFEATDLGAYTAELASMFRSGIERAGLRLLVDCPHLPEPVYIDRDMWEKIVFNLLSNAFKFTAKGEIEVKLRAVEAKNEKCVQLSVRDTGVGIAAAELPRIFERFHRVRNEWARSHEGTGIGLALVRELARLHGGEVEAASVEGGGTTFTVSIPTGVAHLPAERIGAVRILSSTSAGALPYVEEALQWLPKNPTAATPVNAVAPTLAREQERPAGAVDGTRIILADDNSDMRAYVHRLLAGHGYEVIAVADGQAALEEARRRTPELVLSDVMMPRLDGFGLLRELRNDPATAGVPVILLSARAGEEARVEGMEAGADDYLTKPFSARELLGLVAARLELARLRKEAAERERQLNSRAMAATAKFRAVFEQSPVFAGIMSLEGIILEANRLCLEVCGYRAEEVIGKAFWDCPWWRGSQEVREKLRAGARQAVEGNVYTAVLPYLWADGQERLVDLALHPIRDEGGKVIFLHPTGMDITERHEAQARVEFLSRLTQKLSTVSEEGEINRIATQEIGQFLGAFRTYFFHALTEADKVGVLSEWRRDVEPGMAAVYDLNRFGGPEWREAMQRGPVGVDDVRAHAWTKDFTAVYFGINTLAYVLAPFIHEGRWVACICATSDRPRHWTDEEKALLESAVARVWPLIERARVEAALRMANALLADKAAHLETIVQQRTAKLRETVGELESFSYSIAHDMRAPLRSLQGFSDILMKDHGPKLEAEPQRYLNLIAASARRMDSLIRDVLNYSRVVREELPMQAVDTGRLLRGIVETYPMFAAEKADVELQGPFPAVLGNEAMLMQIFSNLMGNAVKFVAPGVKPQLKVWAERRGEWVRLLVRDNGIGIAPEQHKKIFAIFQRVDKRYEGTGIGLAIVKKAVERMGGTTGLESEPGHGSTFWIEVQVAPGLGPAA